MVHVYRDQPAQRPRVGELLVLAVFVAGFVLPLVFGVVHGVRHGFTGDDWVGIAFVLFIGFLVACAFYTDSKVCSRSASATTERVSSWRGAA